MRFRDFDGQARVTLAGSLAALAAFFLPWATLRAGLQVIDLNGVALAAAPLVLAALGTPVGPAEAFALAAAAGLALVCALANFLLILAPGLSTLRDLNPRAGRALSAAGLAGTLLALVAVAAVVGPQVGVTQLTYGAIVALAGFGVAVYAWPKARRLGDDEDTHGEPARAPPPA